MQCFLFSFSYVVSAGISGANFFLPLKALPTNKADLVVGQPIECVTQAVNDGAQSATLRGHPKAVYEAMTRSGNIAFTALVPGMLVNVVVDKKVEVSKSCAAPAVWWFGYSCFFVSFLFIDLLLLMLLFSVF